MDVGQHAVALLCHRLGLGVDWVGAWIAPSMHLCLPPLLASLGFLVDPG